MKDYISFSVAAFDVLQNDVSSFEERIEYRANSVEWAVKPLLGLMTNTDGARYVYTGLYFEIPLTDYFIISPSFAPGIYLQNNSKDLHNDLEFRSQLEADFRISNDFITGFSFNHISNAGLGNQNPGVESIAVTIQIPVRR